MRSSRFLPSCPVSWRLAAWLCLFQCLSATAQHTVNFTFPPPANPQGELTFAVGHNVQVTWTSTWPLISLQLWQIPLDGRPKRHLDLLTNVSNSTTNYVWPAHTIRGLPKSYPMNLKLFNANNKECDTCVSVSNNFTLRGGGGMDAAEQLKLGLGLGLGLGIPLLIVVTGLTTWLIMRKRRRSQKSAGSAQSMEPLATWQHPPPPDSTRDYTTLESAGVVSSVDAKFSPHEAHSQHVAELSPEQAVVEAPTQQEMIELEGDAGSTPSPFVHKPSDAAVKQ